MSAAGEDYVAEAANLDRRQRRVFMLNIAAAALVATIAGGVATRFVVESTESDVRAAVRETLTVQTQSLEGLMEKFRLLPYAVGRYPEIARVFENPTEAAKAVASPIAQQITTMSGTLDIVLLGVDGRLLLSGRGALTAPLPSNSPLIIAANEGRLGREVRTTATGSLAYVFAHPTRNAQGKIIGIVAILVDLRMLEQAWSLSTYPVFAVDDDGIVLVSNREEWRLQPYSQIFTNGDGERRYLLDGAMRPQIDAVGALPELGWNLHVLADVAPIVQARDLTLAATAVFGLGLALLLFTLTNRHFNAIKQRSRDRAAAEKLEQLVRDRTQELTHSNIALEKEVEEHKRTESALRQTQTELIQTGKLAALGQMSTALAHEFNQPLAATRSYADNALVYLDRGREPEARENIRLIAQMADRMASISRHLRNFARKPNSTFGSALLREVVDDALNVLAARIRESGAEISVELADEEIWVRAGPVRLQQVVVNLVNNALDAMSGQKMPRIQVRARRVKNNVLLSVSDFGPGIAEAHLAEIFDPFFTTKGPGKGLGLGLSISYNIVKDFGGRLTAANKPDGGAEFVVELKSGIPGKKAAE